MREDCGKRVEGFHLNDYCFTSLFAPISARQIRRIIRNMPDSWVRVEQNAAADWPMLFSLLIP